MITWEPWQYRDPSVGNPENQPDFALSVILTGRYDDYIRNWAADLKTMPCDKIFFRPMHEMNGNWYPWCGTVNGNRPEEYAAVWRHIRSIFREAGNDKLTWVWSPYAHSVPEATGSEVDVYYPGDGEVDWLGLDGYNWGSTRSWSQWQRFENIFETGYGRLDKLGPGKPLMIAETACAEEGGDKGQWIAETWETLSRRFPRIRAVVWFNINKECDWRISSSYASEESFKTNWCLR